MKRVFCILMILALAAAIFPAQAVEDSLYRLVNSLYSGSYIDFMISNFGFALVIPAGPELKIYRGTGPTDNEVILTISGPKVLFALAHYEQGPCCWVALLDTENEKILGYAQEPDLEILQFHLTD